ncbi:MAG: fibronectin type III domain-containing protein [Anaerolineales bacterium]|nr:fibronectin type III domain-containing protein [Anaerolineales bacterium]
MRYLFTHARPDKVLSTDRWRPFGPRPVAGRVLATALAMLSIGLSRPEIATAQGPLDPCAAPANPIVAENCRPGTVGWRPNGYSEAIQGYASTTSVAAGDPLTFFVDTEAPVFTLRVYRAGYYGGLGAREVAAFVDTPGGAQPTCPEDFTTGQVSCESWRPSVSLTVPVEWPGGVYMARFEVGDAFNFTTFVVRDDARVAEVAVQIPVTTYQAYNNYGGKSTYDSTSGDCTVPESGNPRAVAVSFDRPYANTFDDPNNFLRNDYLWVHWLERQGYDVAYITNLDVHGWGKPGATNGLLKQRGFLSIGHDEYWSQEMWNAIVSARDHGVHLGFFSANTAYWRVRFEPSQSGVPDRVLVTYKTIEGGRPDPSGLPTSTWRDPAHYGLPENQLLGGYYTGDNDSLHFPLRVTAEMARDRVYRNTGLQSLPAGTFASIGQELVGWEWSSVVASPLNPLGLTILAESPVAGSLLTDAGDERHTQLGEAIAHASRYTAPSGALVFNAGTIQWGWGLEGREPNTVIRQVTYNVLADMGLQPATPDAALILDGQSGAQIMPIAAAPAPIRPSIRNLTVVPSETGAVITWETDPPTRGQIYLGPTSDHVHDPHLPSPDVTATHRFELSDLAPDTDYYVQAIGLGPDNAIAISEVTEFRTQSPGLGGQILGWGQAQWVSAKCIARPVVLPARAWARDNPLLASSSLVGIAAVALSAGWLLVRRRAMAQGKQARARMVARVTR